MSDQYTRITCGGSPLSTTAQVVGLLFGTVDAKHKQVVSILDSDDIPVEASAEQQVELHHAVFPLQRVLGWYRVTEQEDQPTKDDLQTTLDLAKRFSGEQSSFFSFVLVQAPKKDAKLKPNQTTHQEDEDLPLTLYTISPSNTTLIALDDWSLQTSEPERIGLEHVIRYQPQRSHRNDSSSGVQQPSIFGERIQEIDQSLATIQSKLAVLESFLVDTQNQTIPINHELLRQVQGILWQLGPLAATLESEQQDSANTERGMIQQLATLSRTVDLVQSYTEHFRAHIVPDRFSSSRSAGRRVGGFGASVW